MATAYPPQRIQIMKKIVIALFVFILVAGILYQCIRDNIHTVIPNQIYRSAQLPATQLNQFIKKHHIKTVINLRGSNPQMLAYRNEIKISKENHIQHYDLRLGSYVLPDINKLRHLTYLLETVKRPILFHCESGADRTGLASAIALTLDTSDSFNTVKKQFSWRYLVTSSDSVGKQVYRLYGKWLLTTKRQSNKTNFLAWLNLSKPYAI